MEKVEIRKDYPFGAYNVARNLLDLIDATSWRGPYLFFVSSWDKYFENGKTDDLGSLRTFFIRIYRNADVAIPVTLDVQKAIACEIEPNTQGGPRESPFTSTWYSRLSYLKRLTSKRLTITSGIWNRTAANCWMALPSRPPKTQPSGRKTRSSRPSSAED